MKDEVFKVRDIRKGNWLWIDKIVLEHPDLTANAKLLYLALAYFSHNRTQECQPSFPAIEKLTGVSCRSTARWLPRLEKLYFIKITRIRGKCNVYTLLDLSSAKLAVVPTSSGSSANQQGVVVPTSRGSIYLKTTKTTKRDAPANAVAKELLNGKVETFWTYFLLKTKRGFKLTPVSRNLITERLSSYKLEELKKCVDAFINDEWPGRKDHLDLIYCIGHQKGKPDAVEKWLNKPGKKVVRYL